MQDDAGGGAGGASGRDGDVVIVVMLSKRVESQGTASVTPIKEVR